MLVYTILIYLLFGKDTTSATVVSIEKPISERLVSLNPEAKFMPRTINLSEGWSPTLYKLVMRPEIQYGTSSGHIVIDVMKDANETQWPPIVLDINNITINKVEVAEINGEVTRLLSIQSNYGKNNEIYVIDLLEMPKNTSLQVNIEFISQLSTTLQGFYRVGYDDIDTTDKKWLVSTQFSPIDARRAFPCFDRPDKKARFDISLIYHENLTMALSNMPSKQTMRLPNGYIRQDFNTTPLMSTYLVAFMATNLVNTNVSRTSIKDAPVEELPRINIWSRQTVADLTQFAFDMTVKILPFFEKYFGIRFNLPKIDIVAVPEFGFGAMENYGLITFRESALLVSADEEQRSPAKSTERVASTIAHELAHQWFGNLVTMKWWNDLWLKEGFATFMSYVALEEIKPSWRHLDFISINELQAAMEEDSNLSSHPISFDVNTAADIRRIFDPISYSKGASIIRMMQCFLGEKTFKKALHKYLNVFQYKNAVRSDLWKIMTEFGHRDKTLPANLTVETIMETWTNQAGYPILSVVRNGTSIHVSQQRYLLPNGMSNNDTQKWHIPITYVTEGDPNKEDTIPKYWLESNENKTLHDAISGDDYFYLNVRRCGYYRVNYDYKSWAALNYSYDSLPDVVIAQLIDDSLNLARAEILEYDIPLMFLRKLRTRDVLPWAAAKSGIEFIVGMLSQEPLYEQFREFMLRIIKPIYNEMGFEKSNESHVQLLHRAVIVRHACSFDYELCVNKAQHIYREWMMNKAQISINPNIKEIVFCTALRGGSSKEWNFAYNRYLETADASEKDIILSALGCTTKPELWSKYLNMILSPSSGIRKQDGHKVFGAVAENRFGSKIAFDFLRSNIKEISEYFGNGFSTISKMIKSATKFMNKDYHLDQLKEFKEKADSLGLKSIGDSIQLAANSVQNNVYWRSHSYYKLQMYLTSQKFKLN
ncbi:aminopeptidase N-like [Contarinia nasturtii]|uniref:aminopeptidase N-like n=1 Tax=Contarinia nasturtii TaxID=265458 RepID=UPI0012D3CE17|nr:aminopeptidase N-like [Contarinia nasturtii]